MLRFRQMKSLQKFASVHANFNNQLASPPFGSTRNATSSIAKPTRNDVQPLWPSGKWSRARGLSSKSRLYRGEKSCDWTDNAARRHIGPTVPSARE